MTISYNHGASTIKSNMPMTHVENKAHGWPSHSLPYTAYELRRDICLTTIRDNAGLFEQVVFSSKQILDFLADTFKYYLFRTNK